MLPPAGLSVFNMLLTMRSNVGNLEELEQALKIAIDREVFLHKGFLDLSSQTLREETGGGGGGPLLREDDLKYLVEALKKSSQVLRMDLSGHRIGDEGAKLLADYLETNTTLRALYIDGNHIGDEGAAYLIKALEKNKTLYALDLEQDLNMSLRKCNPRARFSQDIRRMDSIKALSSTLSSPSYPSYCRFNNIMKRWTQGNDIHENNIIAINKLILKNQEARAEKLLNQTRPWMKQFIKTENEYCLSQLKQGTTRGAIASLVIGGVSVWGGLITWPVLIPTVIGGGIIGLGRTTYNLINADPDYTEELDLADWHFVEEPPPLAPQENKFTLTEPQCTEQGDKVLVTLHQSKASSPRL